MSNKYFLAAILGAIVTLALPVIVTAQDTALPSLDRFSIKMKQMLETKYPKIEQSTASGARQFNYNTMIFQIHIPLKTGEWQKAVQELGPQRKGILCRYKLIPGKYMGAAMLPQTFNHHYYQIYSVAPYSAKHNCYLQASLYYPEADTDPEILRGFRDLTKNFEAYLN